MLSSQLIYQADPMLKTAYCMFVNAVVINVFPFWIQVPNFVESKLLTLSDSPPIYFGPEMVFFDGQTRYKVVILNTLDGIIVDTVLALFKNVYFVWEFM